MFGSTVDQLFLGVDLGAHEGYAIAGMAAVMAGVVRAPITAILLVFELTDDYKLILPIMLTTVICVSLAEQFEADGIYSLSLRRKGLRIQHGRDIDVMQSVTVAEARVTPAPCIAPGANLTQLRDKLRQEQTKALCVVDGDGLLIGIVTMSDLQWAYEPTNGRPGGITVGDIMTRSVITITPDELAWTAIRKLGRRDIGNLPVVDSKHERQLLGLLRRPDVMRVYNIAIARKWETLYQED
jgi:CIC family chloride channel protein